MKSYLQTLIGREEHTARGSPKGVLGKRLTKKGGRGEKCD